MTSELTNDHLDALDLSLTWNGAIGPMDRFVAGIDKSVLDDLAELGYMRKGLIKYSITLKGRKELTRTQYKGRFSR